MSCDDKYGICIDSMRDVTGVTELNHLSSRQIAEKVQELRSQRSQYASAQVGLRNARSAHFFLTVANLNSRINSLERAVGLTAADETERKRLLNELNCTKQEITQIYNDAQAQSKTNETMYYQKIGDAITRLEEIAEKKFHEEFENSRTQRETAAIRDKKGVLKGDTIPHLPTDIYDIEIDPTSYDSASAHLRSISASELSVYEDKINAKITKLEKKHNVAKNRLHEKAVLYGPVSVEAIEQAEIVGGYFSALVRADMEIKLVKEEKGRRFAVKVG